MSSAGDEGPSPPPVVGEAEVHERATHGQLRLRRVTRRRFGSDRIRDHRIGDRIALDEAEVRRGAAQPAGSAFGPRKVTFLAHGSSLEAAVGRGPGQNTPSALKRRRRGDDMGWGRQAVWAGVLFVIQPRMARLVDGAARRRQRSTDPADCR
jgi:hypothetical protein